MEPTYTNNFGLKAGLTVIGMSIVIGTVAYYMSPSSTNAKQKESTLVNKVFEEYDLNSNNQIDKDELEKLLKDYKISEC